MNYRVYYCDLAKDLELTADGAKPTELDEILRLMDQILLEPGHFLGMIDEKGGILQFLVAEDGRIGVEIPDPARRGHYGKFSDLPGCKQLVETSTGRFEAKLIEGLRFEKW